MWMRYLDSKCRPMDLQDLKLAYLDVGNEEEVKVVAKEEEEANLFPTIDQVQFVLKFY